MYTVKDVVALRQHFEQMERKYTQRSSIEIFEKRTHFFRPIYQVLLSKIASENSTLSSMVEQNVNLDLSPETEKVLLSLKGRLGMVERELSQPSIH